MSELPVYSAADIAAHSSKDDIWITIHGKVYDVTTYARDHPGGVDLLVDVAGKDATEDYLNVGHSEDADDILEGYLIGIAASPEKPKRSKEIKLVQQVPLPATVKSSSVASGVVKAVAGPLALAGAGYCALTYGPSPRVLLSHLPQLPATSVSSGHSAFAGGFAIASVVSTIGATVVANKLSKLVKLESSLKKYPARRQQLPYIKPGNPHLASGFLDAKAFKPLKVAKIDQLSSNVFKYSFKLPNPRDIVGLPIGQHVAIKATVDGKDVTRSYTPTSNNLDVGLLELVIKIYPDGQLTGKFFANLKAGDEVLFRGPKGAYTHTVGQCKKIGMIAGGTGITPMYQLIRAICEDEYDTTEISLILANRAEEDILLRKELERFARRYPKNFNLWFMLDHPPKDWAYGSGYVTADVMKERLPAPAPDTKIMLCGPPGMINASKKALVTLGFKAPGAVSRMSDEIFCF
ncbi:putative cytochrome b5 reductase [Didymella exigua CBS 183.55]|uniref:Putative cytochrome b5 reductase n=1 Tax=Didymella exigua CBS 183.55 TaxID=1150837 RepID=A0A6A5RA31_9PLEO|nr:putative cytochrome b5 reductase [Didymella exigua CBS 183.55]KAF1924068.1 putative cytochrome b5 reductase [Didymella exigua CBS 183.55]